MIPFLIAAALVTAIAAWTDLRTGHIPNWLTLGPLAVAPVAHAVHGGIVSGPMGALHGAAYSVVGAVVCALVPLLMWRTSAIGGGDVKLFAALGAACMPMVGLEAEMYAFVAAALLAPARLAYEGKLLRTLGNALRLATNPILPKSRRREIDPSTLSWFRLGPAIFLGTLGAVVSNWR